MTTPMTTRREFAILEVDRQFLGIRTLTFVYIYLSRYCVCASIDTTTSKMHLVDELGCANNDLRKDSRTANKVCKTTAGQILQTYALIPEVSILSLGAESAARTTVPRPSVQSAGADSSPDLG